MKHHAVFKTTPEICINSMKPLPSNKSGETIESKTTRQNIPPPLSQANL